MSSANCRIPVLIIPRVDSTEIIIVNISFEIRLYFRVSIIQLRIWSLHLVFTNRLPRWLGFTDGNRFKFVYPIRGEGNLLIDWFRTEIGRAPSQCDGDALCVLLLTYMLVYEEILTTKSQLRSIEGMNFFNLHKNNYFWLRLFTKTYTVRFPECIKANSRFES